MINILLISLAISMGINLFFFLLAYTLKTDKFTDFTYGLTFIVLTLVYLMLNKTYFGYQLLLGLMVVLWAVRLVLYLLIRILKIKKDSRFDDKREDFVSFLKFWLFQGVAVWAIMIPSVFMLNQKVEMDLNLIMIFGVIIWGVGLLIETVSDWQKFVFKNKKENRGLWIQSGLWKYSRHPNYFGEIMLWWGIFLYITPFIEGLYWATVIGPLFITFILLFVSGIPLLEKKYDKKYAKNKSYQKYRNSTSVLVPLPKKS